MTDNDLRLVSERSQAEIRRAKASDNLKYELREFGANFLRAVRGTGKPTMLPYQMESCLEAIVEYGDAHGYGPSAHYYWDSLDCEKALNEYQTTMLDEAATRDGTPTRSQALARIRRGVLQLAASMLVENFIKRSRGEEEIDRGIRLLEQTGAVPPLSPPTAHKEKTGRGKGRWTLE